MSPRHRIIFNMKMRRLHSIVIFRLDSLIIPRYIIPQRMIAYIYHGLVQYWHSPVLVVFWLRGLAVFKLALCSFTSCFGMAWL